MGDSLPLSPHPDLSDKGSCLARSFAHGPAAILPESNGGFEIASVTDSARSRADWPLHLPQLINPFKHFLWILKTTHAGADLDTALVMARGSLGADAAIRIQSGICTAR